ncbi:MAG TPA: hypothetical protein VFL12_08915, partial [Thermoanaerobaculia bacterium]|nr:hypothetical protein [Thermoanaerobaculia bacterium]
MEVETMRLDIHRLAAAAILLAATAAFAAEPAASNPFFSKSPLQYETPQFDRIHDSDYGPAIEEGMKQQIAEIDAIANDPAPPTFENTLVAMEKSGQLLTRVAKVFFNLTQSNTDEAMQKVRADEAPKLAAHQDAIFLNPKLWARVKTLWDKRAALGLDPESAYLLERYYKSFVRAGAQLGDADKDKLRAWNAEEATLSTKFADNLLAGVKGASIVISDRRELAGLPDNEVASAAARAKDRGLDGKWVIDLQNTTQQPVLTYLTDRAVRQRILAASEARGDSGGPTDQRAIVERLAQLRADRCCQVLHVLHLDEHRLLGRGHPDAHRLQRPLDARTHD